MAATDTPEATRFIGAKTLRKEDPRLVTGHGTYVDDIVLPGMLHAAFVRSPFARARILGVDADAARAMPGVHAVFTAADLGPAADGTGLMMADDLACYVGDPVVLVVADDRYLAEDACELVDVDYEPLEPILDPVAAIADTEQVVHPAQGSNVVSESPSGFDDVRAMFDSAAHVVDLTISQHRHVAVPMETRGLVVQWQPYGEELTIWVSSQSPFGARAAAAALLGLPEPKVRVLMKDVGGGFGQKIGIQRDMKAVIQAGHRLATPVKWIEDRWENLIAATSARADRATVSAAVDVDGHVRAVHVEAIEDVGAYGGGMGALAARVFSGPYTFERVAYGGMAVSTNTNGRAAYRGPWMFETTVREITMDAVARALQLDPLELRRRNVLSMADLPHTMTSGIEIDVATPAETLEQAAEILGYEARRADQAAARTEGRYLGIGISVFLEPSALGFGANATEAATIRIDQGGKVTVTMGTGSHGHSLETTMAQVVAEHLGVHVDDVLFQNGDTAYAPFGAGTMGSRSAVIAGGAGRQGAIVLKEKVLAVAAHMMEASADDLEIRDSVISVRGTPSKQTTLRDVAKVAYGAPSTLPEGMEAGLEINLRHTVPPLTWSNAAHMCLVEVDVHTGRVDVLRYVVSEDCGVMINPMVVEGQIAGGVVQGFGGALYEHMIYDDQGTPLTTTFLDYLLPTMAEVPIIEYGHIETPSNRPGGFKGMGEGGAIGAPACLVNAVSDALSPLGIAVTDQPLSPDRILAMVRAADGG